MEKPKWASDHALDVCGQYCQGFIDDYKSVLSQHCMATVTTYGVRKSTASASVIANPGKENDSQVENTAQRSEVNL